MCVCVCVCVCVCERERERERKLEATFHYMLLIFFFFQNDSIKWESFTFEIFYRIYKIICPRTDIDELFQSMYVRKETFHVSPKNFQSLLFPARVARVKRFPSPS